MMQACSVSVSVALPLMGLLFSLLGVCEAQELNLHSITAPAAIKLHRVPV